MPAVSTEGQTAERYEECEECGNEGNVRMKTVSAGGQTAG